MTRSHSHSVPTSTAWYHSLVRVSGQSVTRPIVESSRRVARLLVRVACTPSERKDEVARLASAIGQCDRVQHAYSDDSVDETIVFIDLPGSVSIHVNGPVKPSRSRSARPSRFLSRIRKRP